MKNLNQKERPPLNPVMRQAAIDAGVITGEDTLRPYVLSNGFAWGYGRWPLVYVGPVLRIDDKGRVAAMAHERDKAHNPNAPFQTNVPQWILDQED